LPKVLGQPARCAGGFPGRGRGSASGEKPARWEKRRVTPAGGSGETLVVRRFIPAARERVFAAWLNPASLAQWMRPGGMTDARVQVDPRVDGKFRIVMIQGREEFEHTGEYLLIQPPARLLFTW